MVRCNTQPTGSLSGPRHHHAAPGTRRSNVSRAAWQCATVPSGISLLRNDRSMRWFAGPLLCLRQRCPLVSRQRGFHCPRVIRSAETADPIASAQLGAQTSRPYVRKPYTARSGRRPTCFGPQQITPIAQEANGALQFTEGGIWVMSNSVSTVASLT